MTDLSKLAATRCAELANDIRPDGKWAACDFSDGNNPPHRKAFRIFVEQAHTLATEALAHPERAAEILAPMILREPVVLEERAIMQSVIGRCNPYSRFTITEVEAIVREAINQARSAREWEEL